ncbi:PadR family transcriptional regulator [Micromonospora sp. DSM 115977]|uniref:PadR family transcriptional regulator n=1 Tax=Micromonospora reichwaldensis TaxID=3075516 RepID=A0ABU2WUZ1_9ACTN|nr:PadR family transcriptional regulator [Micromonospora sp. DSM 115977]MDT0529434.1 PadR family transcriptional regulator [Micromonospora sp. DSM 115977]
MNAITQPSEWLRGVLGLCVLRIMAAGPTYGYAIAAELVEAGFGEIKGGTLYPLLARLEKNALVTAEWRAGDGGPGRKYFTLTETGRAELAQGLAQWQAFSTRVGNHLSTGDIGDDLSLPHPRSSEKRTP